MILSNVEVWKALDEKRLIIEPEPFPRLTTPEQKSPFDTHTVDLTLHDKIVIPAQGKYVYDWMQPGDQADFQRQNSETFHLTELQPLRLKPGVFILAMTREKIALPIPPAGDTCLAARIEGKSSRARCGLLIHFTAPTVHPGWDGPLTLEVINLGPADILLSPGMPIAQLIVEEVRGIPIRNPSQFHGQTSPEGRG
jgi:dCTP deaminase